jgi:23S rRNA (adenine-N6)-dimethyltransferase
VSAGRSVRWGWHQLADDWARRLVADAGVRRGDLVLDVGAGSGAITRPLVAVGARVVAIELHPGRARDLEARFGAPQVTVVRADATDLRLPRRPFHVVANPPFATTTALLKRLLAPGSRLVTAHLVVPRHVALRWANSGAPGRNRWRLSFDAAVAGTVPPTAFHPPPPGPTAVLRIVRAGIRVGAGEGEGGRGRVSEDGMGGTCARS